MLKVIILSSVLMMGLTPFSGRMNAPVAADPEDVKTLIQDYVGAEGKYTKKTHIHLNDEAIAELKEYFHAGANAPKRRTYYDETVDALLMGDYDGGFAHINSGYAKNGDNMDHYEYLDAATPNIGTLFTAKDVTYTVNNTSPNQFFVNLSNVANESAEHDWEFEDNVYTYEITSLEKEGDFYKDALLHKVFYFAAPMLLEKASAYLSPSKITVEEVDSKLVISLYVDGVDLAKLDNTDGLLSQASIEKGLILN